MIDQGFHREAMFWSLAVYSRCRAVISVDAPKSALVQFDDGYWQMLKSIGITSQSDMDGRVIQVTKDIEHIFDISLEIIDGRMP